MRHLATGLGFVEALTALVALGAYVARVSGDWAASIDRAAAGLSQST